MWALTFGTATGSLIANRGAKLSLDDSYYIVPFDPNSNTDYKPIPANSYVGLMSLVA